jgi:hypothetical protein
MQEPHTIALYLLTDSLDSLDLRATEAAMAADDFEVALSRGNDSHVLEVHWQPDPVVHPEYQGGGILATPPAERHTLRFDAGEAARQIRRDIAALQTQEGQAVPEALKADGPVHLMELETADAPRHRVAMLYALLTGLAATTTHPGKVLVYDPSSALCLASADVREAMDWRFILEQLGNPLDMGTSERVEDPDFALSNESIDAPAPVPASSAPQHGASPGAQHSSHSWAWVLAGLAVAGLIAWSWLGD